MRKKKALVLGAIAAGSIVCILNIGFIRQKFAMKIDSLSVVDARKILTKSVKEEFPEFESFNLISEGYVKDSDFQSYQLVIKADDNIDNIIRPTYRIVKEENAEKTVEIDTGRKRLERKLPLIRRFGDEYTKLIKQDLRYAMEPYIRLESDISVQSPYFQMAYEKELPQELQNGMEFDRNIDLEWEVNLVLHVESFEGKEKYIRRMYEELKARGYHFSKYNFTFVIEEDEFEAVEGLTETEIEESLLQSITEKIISGDEYTFQMKYQEVTE